MTTRKAQRIWGTVDVAFGVILAVAVFRGLPARVLYIDVPAGALALAFVVGGGGFLLGQPWARNVLRLTTLVSAILGALVVVLLCFSMAFLLGVHAPVGSGGALLAFMMVLLVTPYLVVFPYVQHRLLSRGTPPIARATPVPPVATDKT